MRCSLSERGPARDCLAPSCRDASKPTRVSDGVSPIAGLMKQNASSAERTVDGHRWAIRTLLQYRTSPNQPNQGQASIYFCRRRRIPAVPIRIAMQSTVPVPGSGTDSITIPARLPRLDPLRPKPSMVRSPFNSSLSQ